MIKLLIVLFLTLTNHSVESTPITTEFIITVPEAIHYTPTPEDVIQAMIYVESGTKGSGAYNKQEPQAKGILQEWPCLVDDVNHILGYKKYSYTDRLNDKKAVEMFWVYQNHYNPELNLEKMARIWCGGPDGHLQNCTLSYWKLVRNRLYNS